MGKGAKTSYLKKKGVLVCSACISALAVCLLVSAIATDFWIGAKVTEGVSTVTVSYGLFTGKKEVFQLTTNTYLLYITCDPGNNACMYSCGKTEEERQKELAGAINGSFIPAICSAVAPERSRISREGRTVELMNYGLWITTVIFLAIAIVFSVGTFILTTYNAIANPVYTFVGPHGLYGWNGAALFFCIFPLALWGAELIVYLSQDPMISNSLSGDLDFRNASYLDYSYWLVLGGAICHLVNIPLVKFRNIFREPPPIVTGEEDEQVNGAILLF